MDMSHQSDFVAHPDVTSPTEDVQLVDGNAIDLQRVAYPMVQPMKAALYFDSAEGFGEWRILISTRADRHLREARRNDANSFKIFLKKIKWARVCGHWTRLTGVTT